MIIKIMRGKKVLPPTYLFLFIAIMGALHFFLPFTVVVQYPWSLSGWIFLFIGVVLNLVANNAFKYHHTTVKPFEESATLITTGVFRYCRHPMYLGMVFILTGLALIMGSLTPFLIIPAFLILMDRGFIEVEEQMLEKKFGQSWLTYKTKVRRWI
jgi:protein-S-isoprenylcysteine O-methyltransferase Ste14